MLNTAPRANLRQATLTLGLAYLVAAAFDSQGLLRWVQRQEATPTQSRLLAVAQAWHAHATKWGLAAPRHWAEQGRETVQRFIAGEEDSVLAEGWKVDEPEAPAAPRQEMGEAATSGALLLLGDSMIAGNLGATLERNLRGPMAPLITRAAQLGTGLARPDVYDWMKVVPPLIERDRPSFVVVALGANDATNLRHGDQLLTYGTSEWQAVYASRVEAMMRALTAHRAKVLWLALPPMRNLPLGSRVFMLNQIFKTVASDVPGVTVLDLDELLGNGEGQYATFVREPDGRLVRYRLDDGVHVAPAGSRVVAAEVQRWLAQRL